MVFFFWVGGEGLLREKEGRANRRVFRKQLLGSRSVPLRRFLVSPPYVEVPCECYKAIAAFESIGEVAKRAMRGCVGQELKSPIDCLHNKNPETLERHPSYSYLGSHSRSNADGAHHDDEVSTCGNREDFERGSRRPRTNAFQRKGKAKKPRREKVGSDLFIFFSKGKKNAAGTLD